MLVSEPRTPRWLTLEPDRVLASRISAIAEPLFVLIAGTLMAGALTASVGIGSASDYLFNSNGPDFWNAARVLGIDLSASYGIVFALVMLLGWRRGRVSLSSYGISLGDRGLAQLIGSGLLLGLVASMPEQIFRLVNVYERILPGTRFWALQARVPWNAGFWLYMAIGSFMLVPIFEELYTRGYLLGRVREAFSGGGTLLAMAVFFSFAHAQFLHSLPLALAAETSLFVWALLLGYSVYRTGSLIPALVAHVMINLPMIASARWAMLIVTTLALIVWWKAVVVWMIGAVHLIRQIDDWPATLLGVVAILLVLMTFKATPWMPYAWLCVLGLATVPGLFRRSVWGNSRR